MTTCCAIPDQHENALQATDRLRERLAECGASRWIDAAQIALGQIQVLIDAHFRERAHACKCDLGATG